MVTELTLAERAAYDVLLRMFGDGGEPDLFAGEVRNIVNNIRPLLDAETLEQSAANLRAIAKKHRSPLDGSKANGFVGAAEVLEFEARDLRAAYAQWKASR